MLLAEQEELTVLLQDRDGDDDDIEKRFKPRSTGFRKRLDIKPFFYLLLVLCVVFMLVLYGLGANNKPIVYKKPLNISQCFLPVIDPWDPSVKQYMEDVDITKGCDRNWTPYTELKNGTWRILKEKEGRECKARCFEMIDFLQPFNKTDWFPPGPTNCEFLEAVCLENNIQVYGYIHTQIIPKKLKRKKRTDLKKVKDQPDVYVFLVDSLSSTAAHRSIPKTLQYLKSQFKAVHFPYMSQTGLRSKPNGFSIWFGKQIENGTKINGEKVKVDWTEAEYCQRYLDEEPHLFSDFEKEGYTTLHSEDWSFQTVTSHPDCKGFKNRYSNYSFYPFTKIYEFDSLPITQKHLKGNKLCREVHLAAMEYTVQFAEAYKNRPKFVFHWFVHLAHNKLAGANRLDDPFEKFFKDNKEKFDNSFVILMADHGFSYGPFDFYNTDLGKLEAKNPLFFLSVPKKYRNNGMLKTVKENAKRLQTHYDTRATLLDILKYQPSKNFTDRTFFQIPNEKGQSLIRKQPKTPRNCKTLPILQQYCLCESNIIDLISDKELSQRLSKEFIDHVNRQLESFNLTSICHKLEVDHVTGLDLHTYTSSNVATYHISVQTKSPAHLETFTTENKLTKKLEFGEIERIDIYGKTTECSNAIHWTRTCVCK